MSTPTRRRSQLAALLLSGWCASAAALPSDQSQPIDISADAVELDDGRHTSTYTGHVEVRQGSMHLWADRVTVQHQPSRQPARILATGSPARYRQETDEGKEVKAHALRMEYDAASNEILLIDHAELTQGKDRFSSDRILYDRARAVVKAGASAHGRQRVHITITPERRTR
jgi:lipopolysaccharide export system protein LptA